MLPFFEGIIAAIGALVIELSPPIFGLTLIENSLLFLLLMASVEEIVKYTFVYNHYLKSKNKEDILASAFFIGLGFALVDIFTKKLAYANIGFLPIVGILMIHLTTATLLGIFFRKITHKTLYFSLLLLGLNIALHLTYNLLVLLYQ
ncbi:MAG: hypothetical protein WC848_00445 [Parcubacteria group bacterium]|jgi:hypothetical protein